MGNILVKFKWEKFGGQISVGIFWWTGFGNKKWLEESSLGNTSQKKKTVSFRHCSKRGGGAWPEFFGPLAPCICPIYHDINVILYNTFWSFLTPKLSKVPKI